MMTNIQVPEGYKKDSENRLVPIANIDEIDLLRDEFVREVIEKFEEINRLLVTFKPQLIADIQAFVDMSIEQYGVKVGGKGGNVTLRTFDGSAKLQLTIAKNLFFDERLQAAKTLVDSCIKRWAQDAHENLHILVDDAFQVDKEGEINTQRVLSLTRLSIDDLEWKQAMQAIKDSLSVQSTTTYVRAYVTDESRDDNKMKPIVLDLAGV